MGGVFGTLLLGAEDIYLQQSLPLIGMLIKKANSINE